MQKRKMNTFVKFALIMLGSAVGGGILGAAGYWFFGDTFENMGKSGGGILSLVQQLAFPLLILITICSILYGEWNLKKQKEIGLRIQETEEEECDRWEYQLEKMTAVGLVVNTISQILCFLILASGYSMRYISNGNAISVLLLCAVFLVCYFYDAFWQVRMVKTTQKTYPKMQGDLSSRKFQQQWLDSCDEAEKEYIYQSAYKCYVKMGTWIPVLLVVAMLGHLFFDTGIMAIVMVAAIWLIMTVSYSHSCVKLKKIALER